MAAQLTSRRAQYQHVSMLTIALALVAAFTCDSTELFCRTQAGMRARPIRAVRLDCDHDHDHSADIARQYEVVSKDTLAVSGSAVAGVDESAAVLAEPAIQIRIESSSELIVPATVQFANRISFDSASVRGPPVRG